MSTAYRVSWGVTFALGAVGLLLVPIVAVPVMPLAAALLYLASHRLFRRDSGWAVILPPALLLLYPLAHLFVPPPFFDNWNFFGPEPVEFPLHLLTPLELLSYHDPYWAGVAMPMILLGTPVFVGVAILIALLRRIGS